MLIYTTPCLGHNYDNQLTITMGSTKLLQELM